MPQSDWYLVTYPNGVKQIERFTPGEADVKSRATGKTVERVIVLTVAEYAALKQSPLEGANKIC